MSFGAIPDRDERSDIPGKTATLLNLALFGTAGKSGHYAGCCGYPGTPPSAIV